MTELYANYDDWKGWDTAGFMRLTAAQRAYYAAELRGVPIAGKRVLEIGFGNGSFLAWCVEQGGIVLGTELSARGRALAAERGITIVDTALSDVDGLHDEIDLIAAFDVLEHLTLAEIAGLLGTAARLLRSGGHLIARFPNGASPFGLSLQHGDTTHVTVLSLGKLEQLRSGLPFSVVRAGGMASAGIGNPLKRGATAARNILRTGFEKSLRLLYGLSGPLDPNLTIVLRRDTLGDLSHVARVPMEH